MVPTKAHSGIEMMLYGHASPNDRPVTNQAKTAAVKVQARAFLVARIRASLIEIAPLATPAVCTDQTNPGSIVVVPTMRNARRDARDIVEFSFVALGVSAVARLRHATCTSLGLTSIRDANRSKHNLIIERLASRIEVRP